MSAHDRAKTTKYQSNSRGRTTGAAAPAAAISSIANDADPIQPISVTRKIVAQRSISTSPTPFLPPLGPSSQVNGARNLGRRAPDKAYTSVHALEHVGKDSLLAEDSYTFTPPKLTRSASINATASQQAHPSSDQAVRPQAVRSASGSMEGSASLNDVTPGPEHDIVEPPRERISSPAKELRQLDVRLDLHEDKDSRQGRATESSIAEQSAEGLVQGTHMRAFAPASSHILRTASPGESELTNLMRDLGVNESDRRQEGYEAPTQQNVVLSVRGDGVGRKMPEKVKDPSVWPHNVTGQQVPVSQYDQYHGASTTAGPSGTSQPRHVEQHGHGGPQNANLRNYAVHASAQNNQAAHSGGYAASQGPNGSYEFQPTHTPMSSTIPYTREGLPADLYGQAGSPYMHMTPAMITYNALPPFVPSNSVPQSPFLEPTFFNARQTAVGASGGGYASVPSGLPVDSALLASSRMAPAPSHALHHVLPHPGPYRGPYFNPNNQQGPDYAMHGVTQVLALPLTQSHHERHPSVTTQGSITPPFTPLLWQSSYPLGATARPPSAGWPGMVPAPPQSWNGMVTGGPPKSQYHRRMQSGPVYAPMTPHSSPQYAFTASRDPNPANRGAHTRSSSSLSYGSLIGSMTPYEAGTNRSPLLDEFRAMHNRGRTYQLSDIRGSVVEFSTDQHGSRFTQEKLTTASSESIQMVFDEVLPHANELMMDVFGNYVVQKLIEHGSPEMRQALMDSMRGKVVELSLSTYGCRVVQRMIDFVDQSSRMQLVEELRDNVEVYARDQNANHVLQKILERSKPVSDVNFIPHIFVGKVSTLATHCYSCRVLQRILEYCDQSEKRGLMQEMLDDVRHLMQDRYGNYVVQWVLRDGEQRDKKGVISAIKDDLLRLSTMKCASNVVEKAIECATSSERETLIEEVMRPVKRIDGSAVTTEEGPVLALELMMKDQYGNYVLQRCIGCASGEQGARLIAATRRVLSQARRHSHPASFARHLNAIQRLVDMRAPSNGLDAGLGS